MAQPGRPAHQPLTLKERAKYVRFRLRPHESGDHADEVAQVLAALDDAVARKDADAVAAVEERAQAYAHKREHPLTLRVGVIQHELDARSDGTPSGYRKTIIRDLQRYYAWCRERTPQLSPSQALDLYYGNVASGDAATPSVIDALERARLLVERDELRIEDALREAGLVTTQSQSGHTGPDVTPLSRI